MGVTIGDLVGNPTKFKQVLDLGDRIVEVTDDLARINFDDLPGEFEEAGPKCVWYGSVAARASRLAEDLKMEWQRTEAEVAKKARVTAAASDRRLTDEGVKEIVRTDATVRAAQVAWLNAKESADNLENLKFTLSRRQATFEHMVGMLMAEWFARNPDLAARPAVPDYTPYRTGPPVAPSPRTPMRRRS